MAEANNAQDEINIAFIKAAQEAGLDKPENYDVLSVFRDGTSKEPVTFMMQNTVTGRFYQIHTGVDREGVTRREVRDITPQVRPDDAIAQPAGTAMFEAMKKRNRDAQIGACFTLRNAMVTFVATGVFVVKSLVRVVLSYITNAKA